MRVSAGAGPNRYEVDGAAHRHPVTWRVNAAIAMRLVAAGVPLIIEREASSEDVQC